MLYKILYYLCVVTNLGLLLLLMTGVLTAVNIFGAYLMLGVLLVDGTAIMLIVKIIKKIVKKVKSGKSVG